MSDITLEAAQARLEEAQASVEQAKAILEQVKNLSRPTVLKLAGIDITLQPGEHYAGAVLGDDGTVQHHLVLMAAKPAKRLAWDAAKAWAASIGGELPTRQEQALLYANCKPHLDPVWHWSSQQHEEDASFAWHCYFLTGDQDFSHKSHEGAAVAVRRFNP